MVRAYVPWNFANAFSMIAGQSDPSVPIRAKYVLDWSFLYTGSQSSIVTVIGTPRAKRLTAYTPLLESYLLRKRFSTLPGYSANADIDAIHQQFAI